MVGLFVVANAITVSRSGLIGLVIALTVTVIFLPRPAKLWAAVIVPLGTTGLFSRYPV